MPVQPLKIHIIDDDKDDVFLIKRILRNRSVPGPFEVTHSGAIAEGIRALKASPAHVILLDLSLPDASGFEGLTEIQRQIPSSNVIILTGLKDEDWALDALKQGASDYLTKDELNPTLLTRTILYSHERQKLEEQLRQSRKIEAIGQLAGGIAHDFNNQIGILRLLVDQLESHSEMNAEIKRISNDMTSIIEKCSTMTKQILGFSRKQALFPSFVNVNSIIQQFSPFASRLLGSDVQLDIHLSPDIGTVYVDKNQLEQVLWNLILNAKYALRNKRRISIKTGTIIGSEVTDCLDRIEHSDPLCFVEISDTGTGMSSEVLERIFDPFFTTKPQGEGTGLGLSTALGFIRQSGGYMSVRSEEGQGSSFRLLLPQHATTNVMPEKEKPKEPEEELRPKMGVLVCDDEPMLLELITSSLEEKGFKTFQAKDGREGIEVLETNKSDIHLIVTDLTMPRVSGSELIKNAQNINPHIKSIIMTGFSKLDLSGELKNEKVLILNKPFSINDLVRMALKHLTH